MITEVQVMDLFRSMRFFRVPTMRNMYMSRSRAMIAVHFDINGVLLSVNLVPYPDAPISERTEYDAHEFAGIEGMRAFLVYDMTRNARARAVWARETLCRRRTRSVVPTLHGMFSCSATPV